jgi:two-component system OmpR family response regulator
MRARRSARGMSFTDDWMDSSMTEGRAYRVLLIDDDAQLRRLYPRFFTTPDYETRVAADGSEALEHVREWRPDVVLIDLMMKVRGTDVLQMLRADPNARTALYIAFSGTVRDEDRESRRVAGFDEVIPKGQEAGLVVQRVRELLQDRQ